MRRGRAMASRQEGKAMVTQHGNGIGSSPAVRLEARAERLLVRPRDSFRHVDFRIEVGAVKRAASQRLPLRLALVVDRSGSMQGQKLALAKHAARAVVERLDERDQVALVIFDHHIETLQRLAPATRAVKAGLAEALLGVEARGATALHEGWLAGCQEVV